MVTLRSRLADFRRRYYRTELYRGLLLTLLLVGSLFFLLSLSEGVFWLGTSLRSIAFGALLLVAIGVGVWFIGRPLVALFAGSQALPDDEAARMVGRYFPDVADRLLNTLQLERESHESALLAKAVEERSQQLHPIPFHRAIDLSPNWRLLRYGAALVAVVLVVLMVNPSVISQGSYRLVRFTVPFQKPAPYHISVRGIPISVIQNESVTLEIAVSGKELPNELYMYRRTLPDGDFYRTNLLKTESGYRYTFENLQKPTGFYIGNNLHRSDLFELNVLRRPSAGRFVLRLHYPAYTGLGVDSLPAGQGDATVIRGTRLEWHLHDDGLGDSLFYERINGQRQHVSGYTQTTTADRNFSYFFDKVSSQSIPDADTLSYTITVIPDRRPAVYITQPTEVESEIPLSGKLSVTGIAEDDFQIRKAQVRYRIIRTDSLSPDTSWYAQPANLISTTDAKWSVDAQLDVFRFSLQSGDAVQYALRVWDNDAVSGPKYADSPLYTLLYKRPEAQYESLAESSESISGDLQTLTEEAKAIQKEIESFRKRMLEKRQLSYEDKKELEHLLERQAQLQDQIRESRKKLEQQIEQARQNQLLGKQNQEDLEKLDEYLEQLDNPEYQDFLRDLQKQLDNVNKRMLQQFMENLGEENKTMEQALERTLELYKQWQANQKTEEILSRLENLKQRQELLRQQLEEAITKEEFEQLAERQRQLAEEMKALQQELSELQELKAQTQSPDTEALEDLQQQANEAMEAQTDSEEQLQSGKKNKAGKAQENALKQMQQMQQQLQEMQQNSQVQQTSENYEDLRMLLENLLKLSFEQEKLRDEIAELHYNDPAMLKKVQLQDKLRDDMQVINDSLVALSKRVIQIESYVLDELKSIRVGMKRSLGYLTEKQISRANASQHDVMTHLNNLANLLVESLTQLQQQMNQQQNGGQPQPNPMGRPNMQQLIMMQQELNQQLQQRKGQMSPQEHAQFAEQQEAIRQQLQQLYDEIEGKEGAGGLRKALEEMEESAEELRKQGITQETLMRQRQILNRLLDYDKAIRERELDNKRKGKTAEERTGQQPENWDTDEYGRQLRREQLRTQRLRYRGYYQSLIDAYFESIR